ncbi:MAG TPA: hypothetical protein VMH27_20450 [Puia sp.]|nr:hypothetical protein [Puia sp.]
MAKSNLPERIILGIFIVVFLVLVTRFVWLANSASGHRQVNVIVPWGLIAIFISLYLFKEYNRANKARRENRREYMNQRRQELLDDILKKNKKSDPKGE